MYFPRDKYEIESFLRSLRHYSTEEKLCEVNNMIELMERMPDSVNLVAKDLLYKYKYSLLYGPISDIESIEKEKISLEKRLKHALSELKDKNEILCQIAPDVKPYKGICIFIFSHPLNSSKATADILSRMNYLNRMIRDVTFILPGYKRAKKDDVIVNEQDPNLPLAFDENVFIDMVQGT